MSRAVRWADSAGVLGAVLAALCCVGAPVILSVLAAVGLSALRRDAILCSTRCRPSPTTSA